MQHAWTPGPGLSSNIWEVLPLLTPPNHGGMGVDDGI